MSAAAIRKRVEGTIHWKIPDSSLDHVTRVYQLLTQEPSRVKRLATFDPGVWFLIFADDKGILLGWRIASPDPELE